MNQSHVIETLEWDCRFARKAVAMQQQERLTQFLNGPGLRVIEEQFDRISPDSEIWRIDCLEVDLGKLDPGASLQQWSEQLKEQLWTALQRARQTASVAAGGEASPGSLAATDRPGGLLLQPSERDLEVFVHYLQQGYLPWAAHPKVARDLADWLVRMALYHGIRLWQRLQQTQPSAQVLERLCHISPHTGLHALIAVRHPELARSFELLDRELLIPLHASGRISAYQLRQLQQSYRVAGLHTLWGSGSGLSAARQQALLRALLKAHRDWHAPTWDESWRSGVLQVREFESHGGELSSVLMQALLGYSPERDSLQSLNESGSLLLLQVRDDLMRLQAALDGSGPLDSAILGELLARLHTLPAPQQAALPHALRVLALRQGNRLDWASRYGSLRVWQLMQLIALGHGAQPLTPSADDSQNDALSADVRDTPRQAAWSSASSWAESLRQFALRMNGAAPGAARPGLSRLQSRLVAYSLRYLDQHGRLPQDHVAWQALWRQAWGELYGTTLRDGASTPRSARLVERLLQTTESTEPLRTSMSMQRWHEKITVLQMHLLDCSLRHVAIVPGAAALSAAEWRRIWHAAWQVWHKDHKTSFATHQEIHLQQAGTRTLSSLRSQSQRRPLLHRLRSARSRWQMITTADTPTLVDCLAQILCCKPSELDWFGPALQEATKSCEHPLLARQMLWHATLGQLMQLAEAQPAMSQLSLTSLQANLPARWAPVLNVLDKVLPQWWANWSQTVRQGGSPSQIPVSDARPGRMARFIPRSGAAMKALYAHLQERSAQYLAVKSCDLSGRSSISLAKALLKLWPRWVQAWGGSTLAEPVRFEPLAALLARPVQALSMAECQHLVAQLCTEAACTQWLAAHDEPKRWQLLQAQHPHSIDRLKYSSEPLLAALSMVCPQLTHEQAHTLHWRYLAQHLFVEGLPPDPAMMARRYALRLCHSELDLAGTSSRSWQRWLHQLHAALKQPRRQTERLMSQELVSEDTVRQRVIHTMQTALLAPPLASEQWEASQTKMQRNAPMSGLFAKTQPGKTSVATPAPLRMLGQEPIYVPTAGLVLLYGYVQRLFSALKLTEQSKFVDEAACARAVHCLEYLVWGHNESTEPEWVLSKMLCGIPLTQPLPPCEGLDSATCELLDSLLKAVIAHWKTLGNTSVAGLRQSFLQRLGRLSPKASELDHQWQMTVEPRAFDMLLDRLPWSYATIKLPWMAGALYVDWR